VIYLSAFRFGCRRFDCLFQGAIQPAIQQGLLTSPRLSWRAMKNSLFRPALQFIAGVRAFLAPGGNLFSIRCKNRLAAGD